MSSDHAPRLWHAGVLKTESPGDISRACGGIFPRRGPGQGTQRSTPVIRFAGLRPFANGGSQVLVTVRGSPSEVKKDIVDCGH